MVFETENRPETGSTQRMPPRNDPDRIQIAFDDHRLVVDAGLLLPVTLAHHLGLRELVDQQLIWETRRVGRMRAIRLWWTDPGVVGIGWWGLHRRCRCAAGWRRRRFRPVP